MRKIFTSLCALLMAGTMAVSAQDYTLRTLTFEDSDLGASFAAEKTGEGAFSASAWSDLIDAPQYGGFLYTGSSLSWYDGGNTELFQTFGLPYWSGGHAISNYACNDLTTYGNYDMQLTVYKSDEDLLVQTGGGHNGSDNFAVHFGYNAASYSYGVDSRQDIVFADGVERVIDHMYVNNTTYFLNQYLTGGGFNPAATSESWCRIIATGYDASNEETGTIYFYLCQGNVLGNGVIDDWTEWNLSGLGAVASVKFDMDASADMIGIYGLNCPAYFAYDDVAVRFPASAPAETSYTRSGLTAGNFGTICLAYNVNEGDYSGATFYKVVARNDEYVTLEEVLSLNAGEAYIFQATASELTCIYSGDGVNTPVAASASNVLQGVFEDGTSIPTGMWFLHDNLLWCSTGEQTVNANRAYLTDLDPADAAPVPGRRRINMPMQPQTPTGVEKVQSDKVQSTKVLINGQLHIMREGKTYTATGIEVK
ncbi:MAG: DUF4465 domain-containing protein [Paludibacteraceae bacterium]|nr:DUF4465 domain-containing protein [Paludibacteraceae bacterium]